MIPILYEKNATTFNTNGLGRLSDAISCHVIEERNGKYELTMEYPIDGVHFSDIEISAIICAVPADGKAKQPFRIYKVEKLISGKARIYAEHISYRARYVPVMPFSAGSCVAALEGLATNAAITNPFTFWTDISKSGNYIQELPESIRARLGGQKGSILDLYGGELEWDIYDIRLHSQRGHDSGVTLRYGKNITDLTQEKNITNTYTAVCPYYKASDDVECLVLPEKYITSPNAGNFPYIMAKSVDMTNEFGEGETATVETLRSKTQAYITKNNIGIPAVSIKVSFVALWQTEEYKDISALERVNLCDTVTVVFEKLGVSAAAKVIKTNYNVLIDRYDSIELGEAKSQLSSKIADQETNMEVVITSHMQKAIAHATSLITGGLGGYVLLKPNADGQPEEILIMDKPDIQQARRMIRMNKNGIGFSDNGYNGPFRTAWVIDGSSAGHFVADYIDTGKLNADLIKTGVIMDEAGNNSWNMLTGEFRLSASTQVVSGSSASGIASQQNITALSTRITANANGISAESTRASAAEGNLSTRISQTADGLSAEITRASSAEGNLSTRITANANGLATKVEKNGVISSINQSSEAVTINANKVNLNGYVTVNSLKSNGSTVIDGSRIQTGIISGHNNDFSIDFNDGTVTMKKGNFTGTITGSTVQSAATGKRIQMDSSVTLKGMDGNTLYNYIDLIQPNGTQMNIVAHDNMNLISPRINVGTSTSSVTKTVTQNSLRRITNIRKIVATEGAPYNPDNYLKIKEGNVPIYNENMQLVDAAYCQLPAILLIEGQDMNFIHGMVTSNESFTPIINT